MCGEAGTALQAAREALMTSTRRSRLRRRHRGRSGDKQVLLIGVKNLTRHARDMQHDRDETMR